MHEDDRSRGSRGAPVEVTDGSIRAATQILRAGGLVAFPTETVYGLGADAANASAVSRIFAVKGRPADHPLIVHVADASQLDRWAIEISDEAREVAAAFWPGPLTLILPRAPHVPEVVTGGRDTVGLRVPAHPLALQLLRAFDGGVAAPSANRFGRVSPTRAGDVRADLGTDVDLVLDGGPCAVGVESTILDLSSGRPEILRPGGITAMQLGEVLGTVPEAWAGDGGARAPGMLVAHYAPAAEVRVVEVGAHPDQLADQVAALATEGVRAGRTVGVLAPAALPAATVPAGVDVIELEPAGDAEHYAQVLYARLRQADRLGVDLLLVVPPEDRGVGRAVRDRLGRAAEGSRRAGKDAARGRDADSTGLRENENH